MKRVVSLTALVFGLFLLGPTTARADVAISFSFFHQELAPYGRWVAAAPYGDVWVPAGVASGWQPYENGHWIYSDYGWTWVSADPWGGYPYHYGTWTFIPPWGWVWVPGFVWAPAWVTWCYTDDFVGWAPIPPSLHITVAGYAGPPVIAQRTAYVFVPARRLVGGNVASVRVAPSRNAALVQTSRKVTAFAVASGVVTNTGPSVRSIERATGVRIQKTSVRGADVRPARAEKWSGARNGKLSVVAYRESRASEAAKSRERASATAAHDTAKNKRHPASAAPAHGGREASVAPKHEAARPPERATSAHPSPHQSAKATGHGHEAVAHPAGQAGAPKPNSKARIEKAPEPRVQSVERHAVAPERPQQSARREAPQPKPHASTPPKHPARPPEHSAQHGHDKPPSSADRGRS